MIQNHPSHCLIIIILLGIVACGIEAALVINGNNDEQDQSLKFQARIKQLN